MIVERRTLAQPLAIEGVGLHTAVPVSMTLHPSEEGIAFRYNGTRTVAHPANVTDTRRSTRVGEVGTVEHLMSALAGTEVTDVEVELTAPEIPGMDGSAMPFVEAILAAGVVRLENRELPALFTRIFLQEDDGTKIAIAKGNGHWRYVFTTGDRWPVEMAFEREDVVASYLDVAPARTFAFAEEVPLLIEHGLGKGLDETSALILGIEGYKNPARFPDEPARHKVLDLMGDLYLSGVPVRCLSVVAERSGHRANVKAAQMLAEALSAPTSAVE